MTIRFRLHHGLEAVERTLDARQIVNGRLAHIRRLDPVLEPIRDYWRLVDIRNPSFSWALKSHARLLNVGFPSERTTWALRVAQLERKLTSYAFADRLDVPRMPQLAVWLEPSRIKVDPDWERFVIKPDNSHSSRAVFLLLQDSRGALRDLRTGHSQSVLGIQRELASCDEWARREFQDRSRSIYPILCEPVAERPGGGIASEFNVFCFYGTVGLILQLDGGGTGPAPVKWRKYYDSDFRILPKMRNIRQCRDDLPPPQDPARLIELSVRMSRAIPSPFVRFDYYETTKGPILGEITTASGTGMYPRQIDEHLGALWENAIARLISDLADGATFDDFDAVVDDSVQIAIMRDHEGEHGRLA